MPWVSPFTRPRVTSFLIVHRPQKYPFFAGIAISWAGISRPSVPSSREQYINSSGRKNTLTWFSGRSVLASRSKRECTSSTAWAVRTGRERECTFSTLSLTASSLPAGHFFEAEVRSSAALNVLSNPYRPSVSNSMVSTEGLKECRLSR